MMFSLPGRWNRNALRALFVVGTVLLVSCSVFPEAEQQVVYTLPAVNDVKVGTSSEVPVQSRPLRILTPNSNRMVGGSRILVWPDQGEIRVYKGVRWSDPAPVMLRDRIVGALRADGRLGPISNDSTHLASDLELGADLNSFQVEYVDDQPFVHIQLDAYLVEPTGSQVRASRRFEVTQPVSGTAVPQVVQAFGQATDALTHDMVEWVIKHAPAIMDAGKDTAR